MSLPPRVIADGADGYQLLAPDNRVLGWVRGRAIGIAGFFSEADGVAAAVAAYRALVPWLERNRLPSLSTIEDDAPSFVHDGAHRWICVGRVPIARLVVLGTHDGAHPVRHAFEIVLRGNVPQAVAIHAAIVALNAARVGRDPVETDLPPAAAERLNGIGA